MLLLSPDMGYKIIATLIIFILLFSYLNINNTNNINPVYNNYSNSPDYYIINNSTSTHIKSINGQLNVFTDNSTPSYLGENLSYYNETLYSFNLSWNCYGNDASTEDNIIIEQDNQTLLKIKYGKSDNLDTHITGKNSFKNLIKINKMNHNYSLHFIFDKNINNYAYVFIKNSSFEIPLKIRLMNKYHYGNISMLFGGKYSNQTVSEINVEKYNKIIMPSNKNIKFNLNRNNIKNSFYSPLSTNSSMVIDHNLNSLIYLNSNYDIVIYNYYNNSFKILYNNRLGNVSYKSSIKLSNSLIYYFYNGNISIIKINLHNLSLKTLRLRSYSENHLLYYRSNYVLYNKNSDFTVYHNNEIKNISLGSDLIQADIKNNINIITYNKSTSSMYYYDINSTYMLNFIKNETAYGLHLKYAHINNGLSSTIYKNFTEENYLNNIFYSIKNINNNLFSSGKDLYIHKNNKIYNTSISHENYFVSYNNNSIMVYNNHDLLIYNVTDIYSQHHIKINSEKQKIYFNKTFISFNITSKLDYKIIINIGNYTLKLNNINYTYIKNVSNATDKLNATAVNLAGYKYNYLYGFAYDNKIPAVSTNPVNNSFINNKYNISFNVNSEFKEIYFNSSYFNYNFDKNNTFKINLGNFYGALRINVSLVNIYNIKFHYNLTYHIIRVNLSSLNINIHNNEYFNKKYVNLTWNYIGNASSYEIIYNNTVKTKYNYYNLTLNNGNYSIDFIINLINGTSINYNKYEIHIVTYKPAISYSINSLYFSFNNNSKNNHINLTVRTNMTSSIYVNVHTSSKIFYSHSGEYTGTSLKNLYLGSGIYNISIMAENSAGLTSYRNITIYVNNTVPEKIMVKNSMVYTDKNASINISNYNNSLKYYYIINNNITDYTKNITFRHNGIYKIKILGENKYGSFNYTYVKIYYFTGKPGIALNYKIINNTVNLNYTFKDFINKFSIISDNGSINYYNITSDNFNLTEKFSRNGFYYTNISVIDIFGNNNYYNKTFNISYFTEIYHADIMENNNNVYIKINGNNTKNVTVEWFVNNKFYNSGNKLNKPLPAGIDRVTAKIVYDGKTIYVHKTVVVPGNIPYYISALFISILVFIFLLNNIYYNNRSVENIIKNANGKTVRALIRESKRDRINRHYLMSKIKLMEKNNKLSIEKDLDNRKFIVIK